MKNAETFTWLFNENIRYLDEIKAILEEYKKKSPTEEEINCFCIYHQQLSSLANDLYNLKINK